MKNFPRYLSILFIFIAVLSCSNSNDDNTGNNPIEPLDYYEELNISYGTNSNQVFDLYLPANRTHQTKVIILVHGGGWVSGDKEDMSAFRDYILEQLPQIAVVNINYRLADANNKPYPMQIDDISSVVNFLKEKQNEYVISDNLGMIGSSAGGHLSLLWSYAFDANNQVDMVCSVVGPTNFTDPAYTESTDPILQAILAVFGADATPEYFIESSPYHQVTSGAPPTILFYGGQDPLVPTSQGVDLKDKLNTLGVINEFTLYPTEGHGWEGLNLLDTTLKLHSFIETYLEE